MIRDQAMIARRFDAGLGDPVTRGIDVKLPWLNSTDKSAVSALWAAGLPSPEGVDAKEPFTRK